MRKVACPLFFLLVACSDFDALERNKPRRVTVNVVDTYHFDAGTLDVPAPTYLGNVAIYVDNKDHGWTVINGTWLDAGIAVVDNVPPGFTLIARPDDPVFFSIADALEVDLGTDFQGPPNPLGGSGTVVNFTGTTSIPVDGGTFIAARVADFDVEVDNLTASSPPSFVPPRQTGADTFVFDRAWVGIPLPRGQTVELVELPRQVLNDGSVLWTAAKVGTAAMTLSPSVPNVVSVAMSDPPAGTIASDTLDLNAIAAAMAANVPDAGAPVVWARTLMARQDAFSALPVQALFVPTPGASVTAPALPFGFSGTPLMQVQLFVESPVTYGGATENSVLSASATGPIGDESWKQKLQLPVGDLNVDSSTGALSPTLTWSGTAQYFAIAVLELDLDSNGALVSTPVDYSVVFGNTLSVRPNLLQVGTAYVFIVEGIDCGKTVQTAPLRTTPSLTCANAFNRSEVYEPQGG